jgi:membrane-associated phospholipid phosphatase
MVLLGFAVRRGPTPVDTWVLHAVRDATGKHPRFLLLFTEWWLLVPVLLACAAAALFRRRWRMALVVLMCPVVAIVITEVLKRLYNRHHGSVLEYPSGHTTAVIAVMAMVVLVAGYRLWAVAVATAVSVLGMLGLIAFNYHYFTDTIGAALWTTAVACLATTFAGATPTGRGSARGVGASDVGPSVRPPDAHGEQPRSQASN